MRKVVQASAPSKIILTGDHSVVYGQAALVIAIEFSQKLSRLSQ